jgi:tRNA nucleotidyltransferase (CCA-adding enzyme)
VMAVLLAEHPDRARERVRAYLERIRDVRLEITGDDLRRAGVPESPALGEALKQTLALKLDGFVSGRDEELEAAMRVLGRAGAFEPS